MLSLSIKPKTTSNDGAEIKHTAVIKGLSLVSIAGVIALTSLTSSAEKIVNTKSLTDNNTIIQTPSEADKHSLANHKTSSNTKALSNERQTQLIHLLKQDCGSCHGMTLKGGLGPALLPENLEGKPALFLENTIYYGRPGTAMPPWQSILTKEEVTWLTQQLVQGIEDEK